MSRRAQVPDCRGSSHVPRARSHTCCLSICRDGGSGRALDSPQGSPIEAQEVFSVDSNETTQQEVRTLRKFC
eukprot:COSAG06_NODE_2535_length_6709_cov_136.464145_9_plen_71_part_01